MKIYAPLLGILLVASLPGAGSAQEPEWRTQLNQQAQSKEQCEVQYLTNIKESTVAGQPSITARIHCTDGRSFDVTRLGETKAFDIRECQPTAC